MGRLRVLPGPGRDESASQGPEDVPGDGEADEDDDDDDACGEGAAAGAAEDSKVGRKNVPDHEESEGGSRMLPESSVVDTAAMENIVL